MSSWSLFYHGANSLGEVLPLPLPLVSSPLSLLSPGFLIAGALLAVLWYKLYWTSFDWCRDFTDFGYQQEKKSHAQYSDHVRKNVVNELRQKRKLGDLPPSYPNGWFVILESDQLGPQGVKEVSVLGLNLVVWRGTSGTVYVADAYCPHMGAHLGVGGKVKEECITCPFHGWQFEGSDGHLAKIPYSNAKLEATKINVRRSLEQNDFIYLWYHVEGAEPDWYPPVVPEVKSGEWAYSGRSEFRVSCHIQEIPENGADLNHLNIVHTPSVLAGPNPDELRMSPFWMKHEWAGAWRPSEEENEKHVAMMLVSHWITFLNSKQPWFKVDVKAVQIGPGTVHLEFNTPVGRAVLFHMVTPLEPMLQKITHRFYCRKLVKPMGKIVLLSEAIMIARDINIWNRKTFLKSPLLPKEDSAIKKYRLWYSQFYSNKQFYETKSLDF